MCFEKNLLHTLIAEAEHTTHNPERASLDRNCCNYRPGL